MDATPMHFNQNTEYVKPKKSNWNENEFKAEKQMSQTISVSIKRNSLLDKRAH